MSRRLGRVSDVYREWHQKEPDFSKSVETTFDFPEKVSVIGTAFRIIYSSDKWEPKPYLYDHYFGTYSEKGFEPYDLDGNFNPHEHGWKPEASVYGVAEKGAKVGEKIETQRLLGVQSFAEQLPLPILATVQSLTCHDGSKAQRTVFGGRQPLLCSTLDKRTLVIFDFPSVILINGGTMRVTERGIVH